MGQSQSSSPTIHPHGAAATAANSGANSGAVNGDTPSVTRRRRSFYGATTRRASLDATTGSSRPRRFYGSFQGDGGGGGDAPPPLQQQEVADGSSSTANGATAAAAAGANKGNSSSKRKSPRRGSASNSFGSSRHRLLRAMSLRQQQTPPPFLQDDHNNNDNDDHHDDDDGHHHNADVAAAAAVGADNNTTTTAKQQQQPMLRRIRSAGIIQRVLMRRGSSSNNSNKNNSSSRRNRSRSPDVWSSASMDHHYCDDDDDNDDGEEYDANERHRKSDGELNDYGRINNKSNEDEEDDIALLDGSSNNNAPIMLTPSNSVRSSAVPHVISELRVPHQYAPGIPNNTTTTISATTAATTTHIVTFGQSHLVPPPQFRLPSSVGSSQGSSASPLSELCVPDHTHNNHSDYYYDAPEYHNQVFYPPFAPEYEWMGRSIESLLLGHAAARAPVLQLLYDNLDDPDSEYAGGSSTADYDFYALRRRSTASTFNGGRRRSSAGSYPGGRRGSLSLSGGGSMVGYGGGGNGGIMMQGGTMANYYNNRRSAFQRPTDVDRSQVVQQPSATTTATTTPEQRQGRRSSTANGLMHRRRSSMASTGIPVPAVVGNNHHNSNNSAAPDEPRRSGGGKPGGPNVLLNIMARESTGKTIFPRGIPESQRLRMMGGTSLFAALDKPAAGMASEVAFLAAAIDTGDWAETHAIVSRLVVSLIGDPSAPPSSTQQQQDPNLPLTAHRFYAGGGRLGLERDAFVQAGGVQVMIRMFREKSFVGQEMAYSYDARDLGEGIVATRLAPCWNEALASLRELVYFMPTLVEGGTIMDDGDFLPFLFTLLSHDSCFDGAAALIEEMLSFMSQTQQQQQSPEEVAEAVPQQQQFPAGRSVPASTFFLGNVPDLYKLWRGFSCRQLAHFCRILALLVFEPEDRQLLESPAVLKSLELLQLRRNRAARAGRDSTVDMNQAILLGDEELIKRLLKLLTAMNYAPPLRRFSPYHVMAHFPFVADTLVMLGLSELESWDEIDRQDLMARKLLLEAANNNNDDEPELTLSELGSVADMLESLSSTLMGSNRQPNQIGHIIHVISAAQQAGVIVGRNRSRRSRRQRRNRSAPDGDAATGNDDDAAGTLGDVHIDGSTIQGLASVAGILTDQILVRRLYQSAGHDFDGNNPDGSGLGLGSASRSVDADSTFEPRHLINTPEDAANSLQFNAMLFGPYQVEVLFVLCTLLGGRRKLDAQDTLNRLGIVSVLDGMFQRLPWYKRQNQSSDEVDEEDNQDSARQPNGIHGPGCECTPESALCVQYLRMLHNFCDRDCDNYEGRRLLLSDGERQLILYPNQNVSEKVKPGLLSKIIEAFISESDESPYRFWLASCIESFLRGSTPPEQMFVAQTGLLDHLAEEICSDRLHCAGSLQTSFDLLGELGKGNAEVILRLVNDLDEESFRKLMSVAAANLVDSNVFIRSLILSLERLSARDGVLPLYLDAASTSSRMPPYRWVSPPVSSARSYLTHSWWDAPAISLVTDESNGNNETANARDDRPADWFPSRDLVEVNTAGISRIAAIPTGLNESVGHFGWVFTPVGETLSANAYLPNTVERLSWFLAANQARLLRDLLGVVDLRNINHENICCLNTAVVIAIFAHRRKQLALLLNELRQMSDEEKESKRRALDAARHDDVVDRAFAQAMRYLDLSQRENPPAYARRASLSNTVSASTAAGSQQIGDRTDVMRNFREVLWFWMEYYTHRGRDRLSLEFSSHIRFQEWNHVVSLLVADDGSSTSLVRTPVRLPRSPYQRAARVPDSHVRGD